MNRRTDAATTAKRRRGGQPIGDEPMIQVALRLPRAVIEAADREVAERAAEGVDRSNVIRAWIAAGMRMVAAKR